MKDILFINPVQTSKAPLLSYILLWIASYLEQAGIQTKVLYPAQDFEKEILTALETYQPRWVGVSCLWYTHLFGAIKTADIVKNFDKDIKLVAGGNTATFFDKDLLVNSRFDVIIRGDSERPLVELIKNGRLVNTTDRFENKIRRKEITYTMHENELRGYRLGDLHQLVHNPNSVFERTNYIWTGKGCNFSCFYCSGSRMSQYRHSRRKRPIIRPIADVAQDIERFRPFSDRILFDFSDMLVNKKPYFEELFKKIPGKDLHCKICYWGIPSTSVIDSLSQTFRTSALIIDTLTLNERLRNRLAESGWSKPSFSNQDIENLCEYCCRKGNVSLGFENIAGLPGETSADVDGHIEFAKHLLQKYPCVIDLDYWPLSLEPGSWLFGDPDRFGYVNTRKGFEAYYRLTKAAFETDSVYPYVPYQRSDNRLEKIEHPFGTYPAGSAEMAAYRYSRRFYDAIRKETLASKLLFKNGILNTLDSRAESLL